MGGWSRYEAGEILNEQADAPTQYRLSSVTEHLVSRTRPVYRQNDTCKCASCGW